MPEHLSQDELRSYITRRLPARELQRLDAHLAQCAACAGALKRAADPRRAASLLRAVERAEPHLSYQQLESFVEARLPPAERAAVQAHAGRCARCAAELADLQACAGELSRKLAAAPTRPAASLVERLGAWFGAGAMPRVALAMFVGAVALTLVWRDPFSGGERTGDSVGTKGDPPPTTRASFDRSALDAVAEISPEAAAAQRANDDRRLAEVLLPLANRGDTRAQSALGLLYAEGRGVPLDLEAAERWLSRSASRDPAASHNLQLLRERASSTGKAP